MHPLLKLLFCAALLFAVPLNVSSQDTSDQDLKQVLEVDDYVRIDGLWYKFKGNQVRVVSRKTRHAYPADIVIPDTIIYKDVKYPVTSIGSATFHYADEIKTVRIPSTIKEIEDGSFYDCSNLESVSLPASIKTIGRNAFRNCSNLKSIIIPAQVKQIDDGAFAYSGLETITVDPQNQIYDSRENCNAVIEKSSGKLIVGTASTVIPSGVSVIGNSAFLGNMKLKSIVIPAGVIEIERSAFQGCSSLESIEIPSTLQKASVASFWYSGIKKATINGNAEASNYALSHCDSLESIVYGPEATHISIPQECPNLKSLHIPATVRQIDNFMYANLHLESISVDKGNLVYDSRENCNAIIETATDKLILGCSNTVIPGTVKQISHHAFSAGKLKELHIPASVTYIHPQVFESEMEAGAAPDKNYRDDLTRITVDPANPVYDSREDCNAIIITSTNTLFLACNTTFIPSTVQSIADHAFMNLYKIKEVTIPDNVRNIGFRAFFHCNNLERISIGAGVSKIPTAAFQNSTAGLTEITVSPANREYDSREGCNALIEKATGVLLLGSSNTVVPDGVTEIAYEAFRKNEKLHSLKLPQSVKTIGEYAFEGCRNLEEINLENVTKKGNNAFNGCAFNTYRYTDRINGYFLFQLIGKEAMLYNVDPDNVPSQITIPESFTFEGKEYTVTELYEEAFKDITEIESITIPGSVRNIGASAFYGCTNLKNVTLENGLKSIQDDAFALCSSLESIQLPSTLEYIGRTAFTRSGLKSLDIPESVTSIGRNITLACKDLSSITVNPDNRTYDSRRQCNAVIRTDDDILLEGCCKTIIPQGVTAIAPYAFAGAEGLKKIDIPSSVKYIFAGAFSFCPLQKIAIPASVTILQDNPFFGCANIKSIKVHKDNPAFCSPSGSNTIVSKGNAGIAQDDAKLTELINEFRLGRYITYEPGYLITACRKTVIPSSVSVIGEHSFAYCNGLEKLVIPQGVTTVNTDAFMHCPDLKELVLPASVTEFRNSYYCPKLERITVAKGNQVYDSREDCNAIIETENDNLILGCRNTVIPSTVKYIDSYAFAHVRGLKSIVIPGSVERLGYQSFMDCADLESVFISSSVRYLSSSYWDRDRDESNVIPQQPFYYCPKLTNITVDSGNPCFDSREDCNAIIETSTRNLRVGCRGTIEPETMSSVRADAYETLKDDIYETDYLSTSWIFPDGRMVHTYFADDADD